MKKVVLANGLTVLYQQKKSKAVVVEVMIKTGSNHEFPQEKGISHFLEHILFEGTLKRPSNWHISSEIEDIGGDFNAYTTNERTCFFVKVLSKHFKKAVDVLADILHNSVFKKEDVEKEKNIVLKEIDMVLDEPRFYQWILLQQNLFTKHPCRYPTYGDKAHIRELTREKIIKYFKKHYVPNNMVISIVGDVPNWKQEIQKRFTGTSQQVSKNKIVKEPRPKSKVIREKRKIANSYMVMGWQSAPKKHKDIYALEVANTVLGRGQSARLFTEIRSKLGLAYDVGTQHIAEVSFGFFAAYACIDKKNVKLVKSSILKEFEKIKNISPEDLKKAQTAIEGEYFLEVEDGQKLADQLLFWEQAHSADELKNFVKNIKKVTPADIRRVIEKYIKNPTLVIVEGQ